jgi:hypothetical protein
MCDLQVPESGAAFEASVTDTKRHDKTLCVRDILRGSMSILMSMSQIRREDRNMYD